MPIVRIESSIPLPPQTQRGDALASLAECVVRTLDVRPDQVRVALFDLDLLSVMVAGEYSFGSTPWIVAWVAVLDGRPQAAYDALIEEMSVLLARFYRVDLHVVRVLVTEYPAARWGIGGVPATKPA
jgi:phenylpyruvate tautomerase PptA (4-oxalocrotonate tautomerase family)